MLNPNVSSFSSAAPPIHGAAHFAFWRFYTWWIAASVVGFAAGALLLTMPDNPLYAGMSTREASQLLLMLGLPASILQWWVLRRHARNASLWIAATAAGSVVALAVAILFPPYVAATLTALLIPIFVSLAQALALWHFVGRPTSAVLLWIAANPVIIALGWGVGLLLMFMTGTFTTAFMSSWEVVLVGYTLFIGVPIALLTGLYLAFVVRDIAK